MVTGAFEVMDDELSDEEVAKRALKDEVLLKRMMKKFERKAESDRYSKEAAQQAMAVYAEMRKRMEAQAQRAVEMQRQMYEKAMAQGIVRAGTMDNDINAEAANAKEEVKRLKAEIQALQEKTKAQQMVTSGSAVNLGGQLAGSWRNSSDVSMNQQWQASTVGYFAYSTGWVDPDTAYGRLEPDPSTESVPEKKAPPKGQVPDTDPDDIVMRHPLMDEE